MPNPKKYKSQKNFLQDCMHTTIKEEGKSKEQGIAQCLNMWRSRHKKKKKKQANLVASKWLQSIQ